MSTETPKANIKIKIETKQLHIRTKTIRNIKKQTKIIKTEIKEITFTFALALAIKSSKIVRKAVYSNSKPKEGIIIYFQVILIFILFFNSIQIVNLSYINFFFILHTVGTWGSRRSFQHILFT